MSKELEALNDLNDGKIVYVHKDYWNEIQKKLKALEIIKDKLYSWSKQYICTDEQRVSNVLTIYDIDNKEKKLLKKVLL